MNLLTRRWRTSRPRDLIAGHRADTAALGTGIVSVVIPLYNHASFIREAVESVLAQGSILREIIVVDDGSSDDSAAVMRPLCEKDERIIFWSQPNRGAHAAINAGLRRATGEVLAILNSDDAFAPGRLATLVAAMDDESADVAASGISFMNDVGEAVSNSWYDEAVRYFNSCGDMALALINGNFLMTTSNIVMRRRLLDEIGLFAPLRYMHDLDFFLRVLVRGKRLVFQPVPLLCYRIHGRNTIKENHQNVRLEWAAVTAFFLTSLWDRPDSEPIEWQRAKAVEGILSRHALILPVHLCMAYLRRHPTDTMERSPLLFDEAFRDILAGCV